MTGGSSRSATPRDVYQRPTTEFVAEFVGASNRIPARSSRCRDDGRYDAEGDGVGTFRAAGVAGLTVGQSVCAIVRPEAISPAPVQEGRAGISATVIDLAYLGHQIACIVQTPSGAQLTMSMHQHDSPISVGSSYEFSWPLESVWLLARDDAGARAAI